MFHPLLVSDRKLLKSFDRTADIQFSNTLHRDPTKKKSEEKMGKLDKQKTMSTDTERKEDEATSAKKRI